jgi:acetolactate synthase-1/2/3 large subunit
MLFAGRAPFTLHGELLGSCDTFVHFVQDSFDPASIVRPYVKWDYSLPSGVVVQEALARAADFMHSDPPGSVYMLLPRETLAETWDDSAMPAYPSARYGSVQMGGIEPTRAVTIAEALMSAENPIAVTAYETLFLGVAQMVVFGTRSKKCFLFQRELTDTLSAIAQFCAPTYDFGLFRATACC